MMKLKPMATRVVNLTYGNEHVFSIPCVSDSDVQSAKQILLRYLETIPEISDYRISVISYEVPTKSLF